MDSPRPTAGLDALLSPNAVAVVGASADPARIGGRPVHYCRQAGFSGRLYPVNPNREEIQGYKAYPSLEAIPEPIDFALLAVPADRLVRALEEAADKGARAAVIFSAGFAEIGPEGARRQEEMVALARARGMRLLGPNCLGLFNARTGHCPTFTSALQAGPPLAGRVGFVTQSGAYGTHILSVARERRIGVNYWISTGNEADVSVADCIAHLAEDDGVDVIAAYMEGVKERESFLAALAKARAAGKPVVMMKVGVSPTGAAAAASHTASLAGSDDIFQAALEHHDVARCTTTDELLDLVYALSRAPRPRGRKLGILTVSGGAGVLMADAAHREGLDVPPLPEATQTRLLESNPLASARNPVDITAHAINDFALVSTYLAAMLDEGGYDGAISFFTSWPASPHTGPRLLEALQEGARGHRDRPLALVATADPDTLARYEEAGFLVFEDPSRAVAALAAMARLAERLARPRPETLPAMDAVPAIPADALSEHAAKALLERAGIPLLPERLAREVEEAGEAAEAFGAPVAMKIVSPDIVHKTEAGGIALAVSGRAEAEAAFARILANARAHAPDAAIEGVLVAPMAGEGTELIVGARCDPVLGPAVMVGFGGIFVEAMRDVVVRLAPVGREEARAMLEALKGSALLKGARGRSPADLDAAADVIARLSLLAAANADRFESIEINPLLVRAAGKGAVALDALVVPAVRPADS